MSIEFNFDADRHLYLVQGRPCRASRRYCTRACLGTDCFLVSAEVLERTRMIGQFVSPGHYSRFTRVQAQVNGFGVNAKIHGIEMLMECETCVRRKS